MVKRRWIWRCMAGWLLAVSAMPAQAQQDPYEEQIQRVLKCIYTLDDRCAETALQQLEALRPGYPAALTYRELLDSWRAADDPLNQTLIVIFEADAERATVAALKWTRDHPKDADGWRYLASALGQRTRFAEKIEFKHASAASYGWKTRKAVDTAYALDSSNADILVGVGGAHFFAAHLPYTLRFFGWLLGIHGDRAAGLQELTRAMNEGKHSRIEGAMVLAGAYWMESDYKSFQATIADVASQYPGLESVRAWQVEGRICAGELSGSEVNHTIEQAQADEGWKALQRGRLALARGDRQASAAYFYRALSAPGSNFSTNALACRGLKQVGSKGDDGQCPTVSVPSELLTRTFPDPGKCRH